MVKIRFITLIPMPFLHSVCYGTNRRNTKYCLSNIDLFFYEDWKKDYILHTDILRLTWGQNFSWPLNSEKQVLSEKKNDFLGIYILSVISNWSWPFHLKGHVCVAFRMSTPLKVTLFKLHSDINKSPNFQLQKIGSWVEDWTNIVAIKKRIIESKST